MSKTFASALLEAQRKKKKREEEKALQEYIKSYNFVQGKTGSSNTIGTSATLNPPTKATYFDKGAFSDGRQRGDVAKTILGTLVDVGENVNTAVLDATENLIDLTATGVGIVGNLFDKSKTFKDKAGRFAGKDLLQSQKVGEWITKYGSYLNAPAAIARAIVGDNVEEYSVLGDKSDSLVQAGTHAVGQTLLQRVGVPSELTSGVNAFGSQMEAKLQEGKSFDQAVKSGLVSAGAEIITAKIGGIKYGGKALTDIAKKAFGKKVANKAIQFLVSLGLDLASEGAEEVASGVINAMGDDFLNLSDKKWHEIYTKEQALDDFIGGAVLGAGGNVVGAVNANAKGVDAVTGLTKNEQAVVQAVYDSRIADMKKNGEKASVLKKDKLWDDIVTEMKRGELSTDDIERVLGGDTYTEYKSRIDQVENIQKKIDALQTEHDDLNQKLPAEMRGIDNDRLAELKKELPKLKSQLKHWTSDAKAQEVADLKAKLSSEVYALSKGTNLAESYHEIARRKQAFTADLSQYNEKEAVIVQKAIDSGVLNNTNHTHEFVDLIAKLAAAKDLDFDFTTSKRLKESGFSLEGRVINGKVDGNTVTINMNSAKALESVVGHEITHILEESPDLYKAVAEAVKTYATTKGDYDSRLKELTELYKDQDTDIQKELVADLVGDYIFSDADFVRTLTTNHRNVAQKIYDEIKYMLKLATTGSKEARQLEKAKKVFQDAFRESTSTKTDSAKDSLSSISNSFFGNPEMTVEEFAESDYKSTDGYKNYVEQCVGNMEQTHSDFNEKVARKSVEKQIDGIIRVALASAEAGYNIKDTNEQRDTTDQKGRQLFSSLEPNSDYFTSHDVSTICDKSKNFTEIYDEIVRIEQSKGVPKGKGFFDNINNYFYLHKVLADKGLTQPCRQCYVDSMRKNLAPMAKNFLTLIQETDVNNKANDQLYNKSGKNKGQLKSNNAKLRDNVLKILEEHPEYNLTANTITVDMLSTENGLAELRLQAPYVYEAFNSFYGQSKPKMPKSPTPFRFGELTALLTDEHGKVKQNLVDRINSTGGFRLQSYSDFQIANYTDVLQVLFEAGTLGLHGHAYTKVPAFLEATDGTNLKRNISIFMYKDGNEWKIDRNDSFPMALEDIYDIVNADKNGNTGIIAVSQNNDMSAWIMANDNIAYGIPFHKSGHKMGTVRDTDIKTEDGRTVKGYKDAKDHTRQQTEVWKTTTADHKALTKVKKGINIYQFWDFDNTEGLSHNDLIKKNLENYIDACEEAGYIPKFRDYVMNNTDILNKTLAYGKKLGFLSEDASIEDISFKHKGYTIPYGYYKFLGDFGMFKPNGEASPIVPISLENYAFDKAVEFFKDAETVRRNEILQQFANDGKRAELRESGMNAEQLQKELAKMRGEVVSQIVNGKKSLSYADATPTTKGTYGKDLLLEDEVIEVETPKAVAPIKSAPTKTAPTRKVSAPVDASKVKTTPKTQKAVTVDEDASNGNEEQVAKVLVEEPKTEEAKKRSLWSYFKESVLDKGMVFENLSKKHKNRELEAKWNFIRYADINAQTLIGKGAEGVKSLKDIQSEVEKTGLKEDFFNYMYHKHNVDRMNLEGRYKDTQNKPVFSKKITSEESQNIVNQYEAEHPNFVQYANDVYTYMNHLRNMMVENGVISQETANLWSEMYPHYVPIRRVGDTGLNVNVPLDTGRTSVKSPVKAATGGSRDILPLFETMAQRTMQTYKAVAKNSFGVELKNTLDPNVKSDKATLDDIIDGIVTHEELLQDGKNGAKPTFTVFENGERVTFSLTKEMYDALKPRSEILSYRNKFFKGFSNLQRGLLTQYNPVFALTNAIKDVQDVLVNSQHPIKTYMNFPKAIAEMTSKGKFYAEYMQNGGAENTYFDNASNNFTEDKKGFKKIVGMPLDVISGANNIIERLPRLAEYIASRESGRSIEVSMLDAARVTTNFTAGGDLTKFLNANGCTFLNASVQGAVQQARNIREAKMNGLKGWVSLATRYAVAGLPAMLLNHLMWDDDEDYEELADYVKENYYIVAKYGDGKFVRIPKGRTLAVIQNAMEQVKNAATGDDEADLKSFLELAVSNLAPNNPLDNNVFAPISQALRNKTWYGEDLVPTRLQDKPATEQYDESTDALSKWLGEKTNISPYKINYVLNQYSGGIGDVFLPMMTPKAESGNNSIGGKAIAPLKDKFTTDSTMNNQNVSDFYDTVEKLTTNAKKSNATDDDILKSKYMNSVNSELGKLYGQKREIQNSNLSDKDKYAKVRDIQKQINTIAKDSLNAYSKISYDGDYAKIGDKYFQWYTPEGSDPYWRKLTDSQTTKYLVTKAAGDSNYATDGNVHYRRDEDGEWTKISDKQLERQNEVTKGIGITPEEYWSRTEISFLPMSNGEYEYAYNNPEKYAVSKAVGGYDAYKSYSKDLYDIHADKDSDGKSISGSRKKKVAEYINGLDIDYGAKCILYKMEFSADDTYNDEIVNYLMSKDDIGYNDMVTILTELGMKVSASGRASW